MKTIKFVSMALLTIAMNVGFTSCCSDDDSSSIPEEKTDYYVKYEVSAYTLHTNVIKEITFATEKGNKTIQLSGNKRSNWEGTYGPVSTGFVTSLECSIADEGYMFERNFHARIYVSKKKEPFVIKAEDEEKNISLSYQIDF